MNNSELEVLFKDIESDRVERKSSLSDADRIREAICAFANDMAGHGNPMPEFTIEPTHVLATIRRVS